MAEPLTLAHANGHPLSLLPAMANRHGLITGATGTGKTVTLQVLAEGSPASVCRSFWPT
jgi:Cdc6-like AAA superfamily ATPase